jgi:orotidine-5'-phosphate decarboxylase
MHKEWNTSRLHSQIQAKNSVLCVGLDNEVENLPPGFPKTVAGLYQFNCSIIDATRPYAVAYKLNTAFYEVWGSEGWKLLESLVAYIGSEHFIIADAKRGDIGNTAKAYARAFFETLGADAVTVNPYMGIETLAPFLAYPGKFTIALGRTSNPGAADLQDLCLSKGENVYTFNCKQMCEIAHPDQLMLVVGATHLDALKKIRSIAPNHFFLVPGVGTQGGDFNQVLKIGRNPKTGLLVNVSREISNAWQSSNDCFENATANAAAKYAFSAPY